MGIVVRAVGNDGLMDDGVKNLSPFMSWCHDSSVLHSDENDAMGMEPQDGVGTTTDAGMDSLSELDRKCLASVILGVDVVEAYNLEMVRQLAKQFGLTPGASMDLTDAYDFTRPEDRRRAWAEVKKTEPFLITGSPPCTLFSNLQELNKHIHRDDDIWLSRFNAEKTNAVVQLRFCSLLYRHQVRQGMHVLHEHPWGASS